MAAAIQEDVKNFVAKLQEKLPKVGDQLKTGKLDNFELYAITTLYLGVFGLLAALYPSGATLVYGGDGDPSYFSNDWVKFGAISNVALAIFAFFLSSGKWEANASSDAHKAFFVFFALDAVINLFTILYGSLSFISLLNAAVDGGLAYFYGQQVGLIPAKTA